MGGIADIAPLSLRGLRWLGRGFSHIDLLVQRKREECRGRKRRKPWATTTEANANDAPRRAADKDRNSIPVNVVDHLVFARFDFQGIDPAALALLATRNIVLDTMELDEEKWEERQRKLGTRDETFTSHPPFAIR